MYIFREAIDGMAARYFTIRAEKMAVEYLRMTSEEMEYIAANFDFRYWMEKDIEFHSVIARGSGKPRIIKTSANLIEECLYLVSLAFRDEKDKNIDHPPDYLQAVLEEHRAILAAVESNDKERAEEVAR